MTSSIFFYFDKKVSTLRHLTIRSSKVSNRQRRGISPVIATTIILAITISLGLALWGFANSGVGNATVQYSEAITDYGEIVRNHRFIIANIDLNNPGANQVAFWVFNNGKIDATISEDNIILTCKDCSPSFIKPTPPYGLTQENPEDPGNPLTVKPTRLQKFYFDTNTTLESGKTYELTVVSDAGLTQTYVKKSD